MLCLQQCIDMCDLTPQQVASLAEQVSLPQVLAAQARCSRVDPEAETASSEEDIRCALLERLHAARDFADLRRVAQQYRAFSLARAATRA
jgi:hypothetical protein